jgi:hypothetical protein
LQPGRFEPARPSTIHSRRSMSLPSRSDSHGDACCPIGVRKSWLPCTRRTSTGAWFCPRTSFRRTPGYIVSCSSGRPRASSCASTLGPAEDGSVGTPVMGGHLNLCAAGHERNLAPRWPSVLHACAMLTAMVLAEMAPNVPVLASARVVDSHRTHGSLGDFSELLQA